MTLLCDIKVIIKHIRTVRTIVLKHQTVLGAENIDYEALTASEHGKLTRAFQQISHVLWYMFNENNQKKLIVPFIYYIKAMEVDPKDFGHSSHWSFLISMLDKDSTILEIVEDKSKLIELVMQVGRMLDMPSNKIPSNLTYMKLCLV